MNELQYLETTHRLRVTRLIASGGMGAVYEAHQYGAAGFYKTVAVKTIRNRFVADSEFVRLFIGEAKLVADLVHENIVQVYNLGMTDDRYFIVMEYVDGITLEQFLRFHADTERPVPDDLGAFIISRVCRGLDYAHQQRGAKGNELGIVHRDISPKNVLLNFEGVVKITDFGIAKARWVMEQDEDVLMGRMEYMAPEQAQRKTTDRRSDIYSTGVVMYELLTHDLPWRGDGSLLDLHRRGISYARPARELRPDLPDDLCDVITRALQPDPSDRYQTAGDMGFALEYHLYRDRYGPTNLTLGQYLRDHFPGAVSPDSPGTTERVSPSALVVGHRAETLFGELLSRSADERDGEE